MAKSERKHKDDTQVLISSLRGLLANGCCGATNENLASLLTGLAHPVEDGSCLVAGARLLKARLGLETDEQLIAAIVATQSPYQQAWANILAARCREAGELSDPMQLVNMVSRIGPGASLVESAWDKASLAPTGHASLERELLGTSAEQAEMVPILVRVLATAAWLIALQKHPLSVLPPISSRGSRPDQDFVSGRLLVEPGQEHAPLPYLLHGGLGGFDTQSFDNADRDRERMEIVLDWVLQTPWAFLSAAIVYEQDIWQGEGQGGLLLELPEGQNPHRATLIQVLVVGSEGDEMLCGSLGEFVLGILERLGMALFPGRMERSALDTALGQIFALLLSRGVIRFQEGLTGQQGGYLIAEGFRAACYRIAGQRALGLYGRALRSAIRGRALEWRLEKGHGPVRSGRTSAESRKGVVA